MQEHGKVVILGSSVEEKEYTTKEVPWRAEGWLHKRMSIKELEAIVEAISPTAAKVGFITLSLQYYLVLITSIIILIWVYIDKNYRSCRSKCSTTTLTHQFSDS